MEKEKTTMKEKNQKSNSNEKEKAPKKVNENAKSQPAKDEKAPKAKLDDLIAKNSSNGEKEVKVQEQSTDSNDYLERMRRQRLAQQNLDKGMMTKNSPLTPQNPSFDSDLSKYNRDLKEAVEDDKNTEISELRTQVDELKNENNKLKEVNDDLSKAKKQIAELNKKNESLNKTNSDSQNKIKALDEELQKKNAENESLKQQNKESNNKVNQLQQQLKEKASNDADSNLKKELSSKNKEIEKLQKDIANKNTLLESNGALIKDLNNKVKAAEKQQASVDQSKEELKQVKKDLAQLQKKDLATVSDELKKTNSELKKQLTSKEKEVEKLNALKDKAIEENKETKKEVASLNRQLASKEKEIEKLSALKGGSSVNKKLVKENEQLNKKINELNSKMEEAAKRSNKKLEVANEGYSVSVNERLQNEEILANALKEKEQEIKALKELLVANNIEINIQPINNEEELLKQCELINEKRQEEAIEKVDVNSVEDKELPIRIKVEPNEDDIVDSLYFEKKEVLSLRKSEIVNKININKKVYDKKIEEIDNKILTKNQDLVTSEQNLKTLDEEYDALEVKTVSLKEEHDRKKSREYAVLDSIKTNINILNDEKNELTSKYNVIYEEDNKELEKVVKELEELKQLYLSQLEPYYIIKEPSNKVALENKCFALEKEIEVLNSDYNLLASKIVMIKEKQEERLQSQHNVEAVDEYISLYAQISAEQEDLKKEYDDLDAKLNKYTERFNNLNDDANKQSNLLMIKVKMQELTFAQKEIKGKIEFNANHLEDLTMNKHVQYYVELLDSMKVLNDKYNDINKKMIEIEGNINDKFDELSRVKEQIRNFE